MKYEEIINKRLNFLKMDVESFWKLYNNKQYIL